ncbi:MAG: efflux RND transporter permease subunit [Acidobacteria bacterium]|nr:efflux RND transporter permease subunit [Acidobacteriota bacterium]
MKIVGFSIRRPVSVFMFTVAVVIFGLVAFGRLPINLLPDISYPTLTIETKYPGAAPAEVESLISRPVEEAVGVVTGVQRIYSRSRPGISQVTLEFDWDRNMDFASLDVRQKLDLVFLPEDADRPNILRFDPSNDPIMRVHLSGEKNLIRLRYLAEEVVKKDLESIEGLAAVKINGGYEEEIQVEVDDRKLHLMNLNIDMVVQALKRDNINLAGGSLYEDEARYLVRTNNEFQNLEDILQTVLKAEGNRKVYLRDVARVYRGHREREVITRSGGFESVEMAIYKEGDANTVQVARRIRSRLEAIKKELPENIEIDTVLDQSRFIEQSIREVITSAAIGGLIAIFVLFLFLKDLRSTVIISLSIPISLVASFFLMYQMDISLNIMSLGGLALGVGMLVDNSIVVLEAIFRKRQEGKDARRAATEGAGSVGKAVVASTLTTVAVFVPIIFVQGIAAQLFRDLALTVTFSLLASLAVALTLIPVMSSLGAGQPVPVPAAPTDPGPRGWRKGIRVVAAFFFVYLPTIVVAGIKVAFRGVGWFLWQLMRPITFLFDLLLGRMSRFYPAFLEAALRRKEMVVVLSFAVLGISFLGSGGLGFELVPAMSQGEFSFGLELPEGTPLEVSNRYLERIEKAVVPLAGIAHFSGTMGGAGLGLTSVGTEGENVGQIHIRMANPADREAEENAILAIREELDRMPNMTYKFFRPTFFSFKTPVEVEIYANNLEDLRSVSAELLPKIAALPGLADVRSTMEGGNPELQIRFDREKIARMNLDMFQVANALKNKVKGVRATHLSEGDREIDILVRSAVLTESTLDKIRNTVIQQRQDRPIFLKSIAEFRVERGPGEIRRIGQKRAAVISGNLDGRDLGSVASDIEAILRSHPIPGDVLATLSGQNEEMRSSFRSLFFALLLAIFLVYLVMASQFESFLHPLIVIFSVPFGLIGVIFALLITGQAVSVVVMIGTVMLSGIVVNNAIVLIDCINNFRREGMKKLDAIREAGRVRLRPILMTSATTVLGLLPLAIGLGEGAELRAPLAITVIGGLLTSTVLTLVVIPSAYALLDRRETLPAVEEL